MDVRFPTPVTFLLGAAVAGQFPTDSAAEVAFAGRSNAGKSSAINALTGQNGLARVSKTPGRTQQVNFFDVGPRYGRLVDLPGYGYAAASRQLRERWQTVLEEYLSAERENLRGVVLIMDIRHPLKDLDLALIELCGAQNIAVHALLSKADKLSRSAQCLALMQVQKTVATMVGAGPLTVQGFSAHAGLGVSEARQKVMTWLGA